MLVLRNENVGNFLTDAKESNTVLRIAWAVIVVSASMVFPTTFITEQHLGSRFLFVNNAR